VWAGTQAPDVAQVAVAKATNIDLDNVTIHNQFLGGGFGRRLSQDYIAEAAEVAEKTGLTIKLVWSREEDIKHDLFRPASLHKVRAALDTKGLPVAWEHQIVVPKIMDWYVWDASPAMFPWAPEFMYPMLGHAGLMTEGTPITPADTSPYEGAADFPYT
ncbi:molybdopterin cofactor-binding domain-containing protein, partial [Oleiphilus sp. HI0132]